jgi:pilus assembly protein CpaB
MKKTIVLPSVFAFLSIVSAYFYFSDLERTYKSMADPITVVVAKERIAQGNTIRPNQLEEISVPKEYAAPKVFNSIKQLFNENSKAVFVSLTVIEKGEQLMNTKVSKPNDITGIANIIPDGHKALSVNFENTAAGAITPGSRIDIMALMQYADKNKQEQEVVYIAAQNILVLAVGDEFLGVSKKKDPDNAPSKPAVTLAVTMEQAQTIMLAGENGKLKYVVRPSQDVEIVQIANMKMSDIIKDISSVKDVGSQGNLPIKGSQEILALINKYK